MIEKVTINNAKNTPVSYTGRVFDNGRTFAFKSGINVIVGENGSGKSTLLKIIEKYLLVNKSSQKVRNAKELYDIKDRFLDGVDVVGDYRLATFRLCHQHEMEEDDSGLSSIANFRALLEQKSSSTGESMVVGLNSLWERLFSKDAKLNFPIKELKEYDRFKEYIDYIKRNNVEHENWEITVLMDEPDRNMDINNIRYLYNVLSAPKEHTQLIVIIHNPLLIYALSGNPDVHFIEMSEGYIQKTKDNVNYLTKNNVF